MADSTWTWVFRREHERLELRRIVGDDDSCRLVIVNADGSRSCGFDDLTELVTFQYDMEAFLLNTGWSFTEFRPERRTGRERRHWPRLHDRRRWWTDRWPLPPGRSARKH
jgi:hypothetical protein